VLSFLFGLAGKLGMFPLKWKLKSPDSVPSMLMQRDCFIGSTYRKALLSSMLWHLESTIEVDLE
jgi:hypothetical protein